MVKNREALTNAEIAILLLATGAMQFGPKPLEYHEKHPDAPENWVYANIRGEPKGVLKIEYLHALGRHMADRTQGHLWEADSAKYVTGLPTAGEPLADGFMQVWSEWSKIGPELIHLNKIEGEGFRRIEAGDAGGLALGSKVIIVDDVITAAGTKLEAIQALRQMGLEPIGCVVLLDREQGGKAQVEAQGVKVEASFTLTDLLGFYQRMGLITAETRTKVNVSLTAMAQYMAEHPD